MSKLERSRFVEQFAGIYEHSPWVAERTLDREALPTFLMSAGRDAAGEIRSVDEARALARAFAETLAAASEDEKLALVRAHPDLVGQAALDGNLTDESTSEQASAGLDRCSADELARFKAANTAYHERFGFPFVMAVRGADRQTILTAFEQRLANDPATELRTALVEIDRIAQLRLEAFVVS